MKAGLQYNYNLQSLRGIAALVVCFGHCISTFKLAYADKKILYLVNTHFAVTIFFVLSGLVLSASLSKSSSIKSFYVKRIFRIYPALFVACALSLFFIFLLSNARLDGGSDWINQRFREDRFGFSHIVLSFFGISPFLLPQSWTIFLEIYASILMPFVVALENRKLILLILMLMMYGILGFYIQPHNFLVWSLDFCFGILIFKSEYFKILMRKADHFAIKIAFFFYIIFSRVFFAESFFLHFVDVVIATCIIAILLDSQAKDTNFFSHSYCRNLGDWSFGIYLLHFPIMYFLAHTISAAIPDSSWIFKTVLLLFGTIFSTIVMSRFLFRNIEVPFISIGKRPSAKVAYAEVVGK